MPHGLGNKRHAKNVKKKKNAGIVWMQNLYREGAHMGKTEERERERNN